MARTTGKVLYREVKEVAKASPLESRADIVLSVSGKTPTITDLAKLCGVTPATVSRVLNRRKNFSASDAVRNRILETAQRVGYVPDISARNLRRGKTHIVGVFSSPYTHIAEGINEQLLEGIASYLHTMDYDLFFEVSPMTGTEHRLPFWRFDAAILLQRPIPETIANLETRRVPYVCVNERAGSPLASILADDAGGMKLAVEHLAELGHKKIAYTNAKVGYFEHYSITQRHDALIAAAEANGISLASGHDGRFSDPRIFLEQTVKKEKATAIISYDHRLATQLAGIAPDMGLQIPRDFSLICFNDVFPCAELYPPLTAISVAGREMGRRGAELLMQGLSRKKGPVVEEYVASKLVVRQSTAKPSR